MRKIYILLVLALSMVFVSAVSAAPSTYSSGFQVQNLSDSEAQLTVQFVNQNGSIAHSMGDTIPANGSTTYYPLPDGVAAGFNGSVVISSDQPLAAITNVLGDGFNYGASYGGFTSGAEAVSLPLIMKGNAGYDTWFNVQNTGSTPTDVTVNYSGGCTDSFNGLQPGAAHTFDQKQNTCLASGYVGAATVTASVGGSIVATVIETGAKTLFAYNGFTGGSVEPVFPLVQFNNVGYHTGIQIQNTGATATDITVTYTPAAGQPGTVCTEKLTVNSGASGTFGLYAFSLNGPAGENNCTKAQRFVGSAQVTANSAGNALVGIVNQTNFLNYGSSYNSFDPALATDKVVMPLIMDRNAGFYTGFNLMNVGDSAVDVTCTFLNASYTVSGNLASGGALNDLQLNKIANAYVGSAECTAPGGSIIAVVNELGNSSTADLLFTYEGFNQ